MPTQQQPPLLASLHPRRHRRSSAREPVSISIGDSASFLLELPCSQWRYARVSISIGDSASFLRRLFCLILCQFGVSISIGDSASFLLSVLEPFGFKLIVSISIGDSASFLPKRVMASTSSGIGFNLHR